MQCVQKEKLQSGKCTDKVFRQRFTLEKSRFHFQNTSNNHCPQDPPKAFSLFFPQLSTLKSAHKQNCSFKNAIQWNNKHHQRQGQGQGQGLLFCPSIRPCMFYTGGSFQHVVSRRHGVSKALDFLVYTFLLKKNEKHERSIDFYFCIKDLKLQFIISWVVFF